MPRVAVPLALLKSLCLLVGLLLGFSLQGCGDSNATGDMLTGAAPTTTANATTSTTTEQMPPASSTATSNSGTASTGLADNDEDEDHDDYDEQHASGDDFLAATIEEENIIERVSLSFNVLDVQPSADNLSQPYPRLSSTARCHPRFRNGAWGDLGMAPTDEECQGLCSQEPTCKFVSRQQRNWQCTSFNACTQMQAIENYVTWQRPEISQATTAASTTSPTTTGAPQVFSYARVSATSRCHPRFRNSYWGDLGNADTDEACQSLCSQQPTCKFVAWKTSGNRWCTSFSECTEMQTIPNYITWSRISEDTQTEPLPAPSTPLPTSDPTPNPTESRPSTPPPTTAQPEATTPETTPTAAPATPSPLAAGAPWSAAEQAEIRTFLFSTWQEHRGSNVFSMRNRADRDNGLPTAPNMVRLGFHDCMKYEDGTGGCDGCLNWEGISFRVSEDARRNALFPSQGADSRTQKPSWLNPHRGLEASVKYLETVYTTKLSATGRSLKETGKSRADLWAFASIAAINFTIQVNNDACAGNQRLGRPDTTCLQDSDPSGCEVSLPRPIAFQTGRRDCGESYMAVKREHAPTGDLPGPELTKYFKGDFGFDGRESVAIMGAHTLGNFQIPLNGYFYTVTTQQEDAFNNQYFRNMALKEDWFYEDRNCMKQGTANGTRGKAKWMMKAESAWLSNAPVQWIQHKFICPNCEWVRTNKWPASYPEMSKAYDRDACTKDVPEGKACRPGTEKWRFVWARDESGAHSDLGMYYDFKVDADGFPYGCTDLDATTGEAWRARGRRGTGNTELLKSVTNRNVDHGCGFQTHAEPAGSQPLYKIVEEFADDKVAWLKVFVPTMERMLSNGYSDLVPAL